MGQRVIAADVLDSRKDDWTISDDGIDRGPIYTWPAPRLSRNDSNPTLGPKARLTRTGMPDAYAFLRPQLDQPILSRLDFDDEEGPAVPTSDVSGFPSFRTVAKPLSSFSYDVPGFDRYEAGLLMRFLARTDAGALDAWSGCDGHQCQGLMNVIHDAGMPKSWYDDMGRVQARFVALLKEWSGGKLLKGDEDLLNRKFGDFYAHATDDEKWNRFNDAKALTFKLLDSIDAPIVSGGFTAAQAAMAIKNIFGGGSNEKIVAAPIVRAPMSPDHDAHRAEFERMWKGLEAHVNGQSSGIFSSIGDALGSVGSAIGSVGKGVVSVAKGIATPVAALVTSPIRLAADIATGKNVFQAMKDTVKRDLSSVKEIAPYVQAAISVIPGVGAGVNAAIAAGAALAQGQPITSALVAGLKNAMPGGPIAAQAFDTAYAVARGQNVGEAALQALVNNAPGGELGKQAAQAAISVAKGQNIQQAALGLAKGVVSEKLGTLVPAGVPDIARSVVSDVVQGKNLGDVAQSAIGGNAMVALNKLSPFAVGVMNGAGPRVMGTLTSVLPTILPQDSRMVAQSLLNNPMLRNLPVEDLARKLDVSTHIAREGMGAVLQAVQKSGGSSVPSLSYSKALASRVPVGMTFDGALARFGSKVAPKTYNHNAASPVAAARLRRAGAVFHALSARGLDCGALDPLSMPTIRQGSTGEPVVQWQKILGVTADGKFGPATHAATVAFQRKNSLTADGIVGPKTWAAGLVQLVSTAPPQTVPGTSIPISVPPPTSSAPIIAGVMPTIRRGSTGAPVKTWQTFLAIPTDGQFGPQTEDATKAFQTKNGLVADGIVGPKTWEKAMSGTSAPPVFSTPPITLPPLIPGMPPVTIPPVVVSLPPGMPPVVTTQPLPPNPPGMPPPPPPITTSPPGTPPVVIPPKGTTTSTGSSGLLIGAAVVVGGLLLMGSGSRSKLT